MKKLLKPLLWLIVLTVGVSLVLSFGLIGCKPEVKEPAEEAVEEAPAEEEVTKEVRPFEGEEINALLIGGPEYDPWWEKVTSNFEEETGIKVTYTTLTFEEMVKKQVTLAAAKSSEFDVYSTHHAQIGAFLTEFEPLNAYLAGDEKDFPEGQIGPAILENGDIIAVPKHFDARTLYYRTDIFEEAGLQPPKTWDELVEIALELNNPPEMYGFVITGVGDPFLRQYSDFLWMWGGDFIDDNMNPIFNSPEGIEALQFYVDIIHKYKIVPPDSAGYRWEEPTRIFATGKAAMVQDWPGNLGVYNDSDQSEVVGKFGVAPLPSGPKTSISTAVSHMMAINKYSNNKDIAWEFVNYIVSDKVLLENYEFSGHIPTRMSALEGIVATAEEGIEKQRLEALLEALSTGATWPVFPEWMEVAPAIWTEGEAAITQIKTPEDALSDAEETTLAILRRAGYIE